MITENALHILFRRIQPETVLQNWLDSHEDPTVTPLSICPNKLTFNTALQNEYKHYSTLEAEYVYDYFDSRSQNSVKEATYKSYGVFGVIAQAVKDYLILDPKRDCLCKYTCLKRFRELTHTIDPMLFIAAFLAMKDREEGYREREAFSWPPTVRTDNVRLHHLLDKGIAENHFHIGGSVDPFAFSWICLMNKYSPDRKDDFKNLQSEIDPLDTVRVGASVNAQSLYLLTFKAACIRYYLYRKLTGTLSTEEEKEKYQDWLRIQMRMSLDCECDLSTFEFSQWTSALADECVSEFKDGFVPDYALRDEPLPPMDDKDRLYYSSLAIRNYERRLFRPLAGEQRFLYLLFRAIFSSDPLIQEELDLAYAYLLIYCRLRGEMVQVNDRVGFSNFQKYQNRKDSFLKKHEQYGNMCTRIAQQLVLANPQVSSFEVRAVSSSTEEKLVKKLKGLYTRATEYPYADKKIRLMSETKKNAEKKLHYVLTFPKEKQLIGTDEIWESQHSRNSGLRDTMDENAVAFIEAAQNRPDVMTHVTGIDACSEEIDCRPEVFACQFRRLRQFRAPRTAVSPQTLYPTLRITYHAGEDFLDPIDGLRAISEAIRFCEMTGGDRLGHAMALGVDLEDWYTVKEHHVLLRKQAILDNLVWLYGQMHRYNIQNPETEGYIQKRFKKYFTEIYTRNLKKTPNSLLYSVDVMDYYSSLQLRGNDPYLYSLNPEVGEGQFDALEEKIREEAAINPWKILKGTERYDELSTTLYHYYHFNYAMKRASDEIDELTIPRCVVQTVCMVQEQMRYEISQRNIGIECNPSSNFLIGTFKDYLKHPIFRFNDESLYPLYDPRSQIRNPRILASINTDDLGIFSTSLENEYALIACALEENNAYCPEDQIILPDNIYKWLDNIRQNGLDQSFIHITHS